MQIERVPLPGVGVGYTVHTEQGQVLGIVCHRGGRRDVVVYAPGDPDTVERSVTLSPAEAQEVAELLHPIATVDHVTHLQRHREAISVAELPVTAASPYDGRTLAEAVARTHGVSVIAVVRDGRTTTAPGLGHVLVHGDVLVVAGAQPSIGALSRALVHAEL
ncbi:cation:proton antiporter regulatory subunit [Micromonospora echinofusca]|uniref:TrkA domain protein n=1 Tax=Micromonospora echinofusca TaxID=47858 RepID=A0A1C5G9B5_MICEH|nr:TrkA C-terminal domain-containing protein [Micromonospora echinofusca]SCG16469.1 TrkA domain protein [Micromonospora echinofusca]